MSFISCITSSASVQVPRSPLWELVLFFYAFLISFSDIRHSTACRSAALSTTSPLFQRWSPSKFSQHFPEHFSVRLWLVPLPAALLCFRHSLLVYSPFFAFTVLFQRVFWVNALNPKMNTLIFLIYIYHVIKKFKYFLENSTKLNTAL